MFDVGFWEMAFIGVIALVVIGPERLPGVARSVGMWVGKGRRMINEVKTDIKREMREQDLKDAADFKKELDDIAKSSADSFGLKETAEELNKTIGDVSSTMKKATEVVESAPQTVTNKTAAKKTGTKKASTTKRTAKKKTSKSVSKKSVAKKSPTRKTSSKKTPSKKKTAVKKTVVKKITSTNSVETSAE